VFGDASEPVQILIEYCPPALRLMLFGAGPDAVPLVRLADELGWDPWVIDPRSSFARPERFPEATRVIGCEPAETSAQIPLDRGVAAVVMTHNYLHDREILRALLGSPVSYIGALGPKKRTEDLLVDLRQEGVAPTEERRETLFGPAGLDIGADSPEQIALSIVAEVQAVWAGRPGGWLRDRKGPIHESHP
jgi:xanthine dehydrogenase accessory factor